MCDVSIVSMDTEIEAGMKMRPPRLKYHNSIFPIFYIMPMELSIPTILPPFSCLCIWPYLIPHPPRLTYHWAPSQTNLSPWRPEHLHLTPTLISGASFEALPPDQCATYPYHQVTSTVITMVTQNMLPSSSSLRKSSTPSR